MVMSALHLGPLFVQCKGRRALDQFPDIWGDQAAANKRKAQQKSRNLFRLREQSEHMHVPAPSSSISCQ